MRTRKITQALGRATLKAKKESPHIFFAAGLAGVVTGGVLACRATLKLEKNLDEIRGDIETVKEAKKLSDEGKLQKNLNDQEYYQLMGAVYAKSTFKLIRLYGPSVLIAAAGVALLTGSHIQMTRRNAALQGALVAVQQAYDEYRQRVAEEIGEDKERELYENLKGLDPLDPNSKKAGSMYSVHARIFDESCGNWQKNPEHNHVFLKLQQEHANYKLHSRGHIFLNDVYDLLGFERTQSGAIVGWVLTKDGDNYVDFGIDRPENAEFLNGRERNVWLDFNVDGVVFDKI